jgi:hypothetical protein
MRHSLFFSFAIRGFFPLAARCSPSFTIRHSLFAVSFHSPFAVFHRSPLGEPAASRSRKTMRGR